MSAAIPRRVMAALSLLAVFAGVGAAQQLRAVQVFVALAQRTDAEARAAYLKTNAGSPVAGAGHLEAVLARTYFDTSVPHANPAVALIQVGPARKVVCGLPQAPTREDMERLREGAAISFRGKLVDGQDWESWQTLYLGDCAVHPR